MMEALTLPRRLNLDLPSDVDELLEAGRSNENLNSLLESELNDYLGLFAGQEWRTVYHDGSIVVPTSEKGSTGFRLSEVLHLTRILKRLGNCAGFSTFFEGFKNPTQIESTYFEAIIAGWIIDRECFKAIEFSPKVHVRGSIKFPDFLWVTQLGNLYCECKRANNHASRFQQHVARLKTCLDRAYWRQDNWNPTLRFDVRFDGPTTNRIERQFRSVILQATESIRSGDWAGKKFHDGYVSATLRPRSAEMPSEPNTVLTSMAQVGPVAVRLVDATYLTLAVSTQTYVQRTVAKLLRDARTQLPTEVPSAVFIDLQNGMDVGKEKLMQVLGEPQYVNTPWVGVYAGGYLSCVYRNDQQFDARLMV